MPQGVRILIRTRSIHCLLSWTCEDVCAAKSLLHAVKLLHDVASVLFFKLLFTLFVGDFILISLLFAVVHLLHLVLLLLSQGDVGLGSRLHFAELLALIVVDRWIILKLLSVIAGIVLLKCLDVMIKLSVRYVDWWVSKLWMPLHCSVIILHHAACDGTLLHNMLFTLFFIVHAVSSWYFRRLELLFQIDLGSFNIYARISQLRLRSAVTLLFLETALMLLDWLLYTSHLDWDSSVWQLLIALQARNWVHHEIVLIPAIIPFVLEFIAVPKHYSTVLVGVTTVRIQVWVYLVHLMNGTSLHWVLAFSREDAVWVCINVGRWDEDR